jgi:hypothetical protein
MRAQPRWFACSATLLIAAAPLADGKTRADCEREYTPQLAQEGKDVIWEPTAESMVARLLAMANVTPADKLYDLGSGDGKIPIAASKLFGATAVGIEYDADLVKHSRCLAEAEGVQARVTFIEGDIFAADFSDATVVTVYLLPELNLRLRPTLLAMKPGTRIVSYSFTMGDWQPDDHIDSFGEGSAYFWIVPANVDGAWTFRPAGAGESFEVELDQTFQKLKGVAHGALATGELSGATIDFAFTDDGEPIRVTGAVDAERIAATVIRGDSATQYVGTRH